MDLTCLGISQNSTNLLAEILRNLVNIDPYTHAIIAPTEDRVWDFFNLCLELAGYTTVRAVLTFQSFMAPL